MNDRASAAPPVQFLTNDENVPPTTYFEDFQPQLHHNIKRKPVPSTKSTTTTIRAIRDDESEDLVPKPKEKTAAKKSSRIFGQVWDGVFGMLSGKGSESSGRKKTPSMMSTASTATTGSTGNKSARDSKEVKLEDLRLKLQQNDSNSSRPSKEDVLQSYNELVASGFFSSHAIQSTRHSRPGTAKSTAAPAPFSGETRPTQPPQWPLSTPSKQQAQSKKQILQQHQPHVLSPIPMTPGSAGSRGKKRAAAEDHDDDGYGGDDHDQAATPRSASKKLRKSASRDVSGAGPRLRSVGSRRILSRRSFSGITSKLTNTASPSQQSSPQAVVTVRGPLLPQTSPSKLTKRPPPSTTGRPTVRAPLPIPGRSSSASYRTQQGFDAGDAGSHIDARVLRPRRSALTGTEARSVVPDVDMGIPGVPAIPPEFTYGEDRVVGGPWRGLRR